ncbi:MAG: choice-of-anchor tandem repeat GloVer-containing protein [Terriglobales bacterium]
MTRFNAWKHAFAVLAFCVGAVLLVPARTLKTIRNFHGWDGNNPYSALIQGTDGNLYGTTVDGGAYHGGTIFKITPNGELTRLYSFCSQDSCADGEYPVMALVEGPDGNFYGTTQSGGTSGGWGTVFKITPMGTLTTLYSFGGPDGAGPYSPLLIARNGNFYGTTNGGGNSNAGTVYAITSTGTLTTLYNFCSQAGCTDGQYPVGALIQASDGEIYGTTHAGGSYAACNVDGCGTVFKITLSGKLTTLHAFDATDGDYPYGGVVEGAGKIFYGTTGAGGANDEGTVFAMTAKGALTTLHSFEGTDGATPYGILLGTDGNFYGTTETLGNHFGGTVFEMTPAGTLTTLHNFDGTNGKNSYCGLVEGTNGVLYGTTYFGGVKNDGTVFSISIRRNAE